MSDIDSIIKIDNNIPVSLENVFDVMTDTTKEEKDYSINSMDN